LAHNVMFFAHVVQCVMKIYLTSIIPDK